jgi:hypothetical protein
VDSFDSVFKRLRASYRSKDLSAKDLNASIEFDASEGREGGALSRVGVMLGGSHVVQSHAAKHDILRGQISWNKVSPEIRNPPVFQRGVCH